MNRRATFNFYVSLPDDADADTLEQATTAIIGFVSNGGFPVLNATWSCPELGRKSTPPGPVLAFERKP